MSEWHDRRCSAADAVSTLRPGDHVFVGSACATPRALLEALQSRPKPLDGVVLVHSLTDRVGIGDPPTTRYRLAGVGLSNFGDGGDETQAELFDDSA